MRDILIVLTLALLVLVLVLPMNIFTGYAVAGTTQTAEGIASFKLIVPTSSKPVPTGNDVTIQFTDLDGMCVDITFEVVTTEGTATADQSQGNTGGGPPSGFKAVGKFVDLATTAAYSGTVEVCMGCFDVKKGHKIMHYENNKWIDITTINDPVNDILCGEITTLSPFGAFSRSVSISTGGGGSSRKIYETEEKELVVEQAQMPQPVFETIEINQEPVVPVPTIVTPIEIMPLPSMPKELPTVVETNAPEKLKTFLYLLLGLSIAGIISLVLLSITPKKKNHKNK